MNALQTVFSSVGRVFLALNFFISGLGKISSYAATQEYMEAMGVSTGLLPMVIALEVIGGLAIIVGWKTRYFVIALAGFSLLSAILFHADFADQNQMNSFLKNVAITGGFFILFAFGPGDYSLDNRNNN